MARCSEITSPQGMVGYYITPYLFLYMSRALHFHGIRVNPGHVPVMAFDLFRRVPVMAFGLFRACPRYGTRSNSGRVPVMAFGLIPGVSPLWHSIYSGRVPVMAFGLFRACPRHGIRSNSGRAPVMVFSLLTFRVTSHPLLLHKV